MLHAELTASATAREAREVDAGDFDAYVSWHSHLPDRHDAGHWALLSTHPGNPRSAIRKEEMRRAIVTGGQGGLGAACATRLFEQTPWRS